MKNILVLFMCIFVTSFISACSKNDDKKNSNPPPHKQDKSPKAVDLAGKSVEEVLEIKYNKADLICALWTQINQKLNLDLSPNDSVSWDLKSKNVMPEVLNLSGQVQDHRIEVQIKLNSLALYSSLSFRDSDWTHYQISYSPYVNVSVNSEELTTYPIGLLQSSSYSSSREIKEKIKDIPINGSLAVEPVQENGVTIDREAYHDYVHCFIDTEIKPEYQDQFQVQPKN